MVRPLERLAGKERIKFLFVRPPHHYWPIINQSDNFLIPLNYPVLAGWLRAKLPWVDVEILDCCVEKIGYASLGAEIRRRKPDVVGIGEKVVYANDALRTFEVIKKVNPTIVTIGGGHIFTHAPEWALRACGSLDYVVRYEAEIALERLLTKARQGLPETEIESLMWLEDGQLRETRLAPVVEDLDELPMPALDLMPVDKYSPFGLLWPKAATIQRSRGCVDTCNFCSWIAMEDKQVQAEDGTIKRKPWFRSKSVAKVLEEVDILYNQYGVRYLFWVDATWNVDDAWLREFCSAIIERKYDLGWWAFTRYDLLPKQHDNGTLKLMVDAGLRHVLVGVERVEGGLNWLNKHRYSESKAVQAFHILRDHYPQVFRQATFITGVRDDDEQSIKGLLAHAHACDLDFAAFHACTPFPGTELYDQAKANGWLLEDDFGKYDMFVPIMETEHLTRDEVAHLTTWCQQNFVAKKPLRYAKRLFSRHPVRRRLHWWFALSIGGVLGMQAVRALRGEGQFEGFGGVNRMWKPSWYEQ